MDVLEQNSAYFRALSKVKLENLDEFHRVCAELDNIDSEIYRDISHIARGNDYGVSKDAISRLVELSQEDRYNQDTIKKYGGRNAISKLILEHMSYIVVFYEMKNKEKEDKAYRDKKSCEKHFAERANELKAKEFAKFIDTAVANLAPEIISKLMQIMSGRT